MSKKRIKVRTAMRELGSYGGKKTRKKYGKKYFSELAKRRWALRDNLSTS
jgi:hypothetical protein